MPRKSSSRRSGPGRPASTDSGSKRKGTGSGGRGSQGAGSRSKSSSRAGGRKKSSRRPATKSRPADANAAGTRLQKVLAESGLGSRRQCEQLIVEGRVEVDGEVVSELGSRVDPVHQQIRIDGVTLSLQKKVYLMLHKPTGVVTSAHDPSGRPRVVDMVPDNPRVFPVGRLDMHSEGLLLLTNDGDLTNGLTHPSFHVEKVYRVVVAGEMTVEKLAELRKGVYLAEGLAKVEGVRIVAKHKHSTLLEMVLTEGKNREIRRLLARQGNKVMSLQRVSVGGVKLGDLPSGAYRPLRPNEIQRLRAVIEDQGDAAESETAPRALETKASSPPSRKKRAEDKPVRAVASKGRGKAADGTKPAAESKSARHSRAAIKAEKPRLKFPSMDQGPSSGARVGTTIGLDDEPHVSGGSTQGENHPGFGRGPNR